MKNRALVFYSIILFLLASTVISSSSKPAFAGIEKGAGTPGAYLRILISPDQQTLFRGDSASFTIIVLNSSSEVNLTNVVVKDLLAPDCNRTIGNLPADSNFPPYKCTMNNIQEPTINWITVEGTNPVDEQLDLANDSASIDIIDISVTLSADPSSIQWPGGKVEYSILARNTGSVPLILNSLSSPQFGDLTDPGNQIVEDNSCLPNPNLPLLPANGGESNCSFSVDLFGESGQIATEVSVGAQDSGGKTIFDTDTINVIINDPDVYTAYFPIVVDKRDEPNNDCFDAYPLSPNQAYHFLPNDSDDWYHFDLSQKDNVFVELTNFVPRLGQVIVYAGDNCNSLQILKNNGNDLETKIVPLGIQPPGRYFILVINDGEPNYQERYQLQVTIP